jgi:2-methylfumaryl-CoA isomerase
LQRILDGMRIVEGSAFIAAPSGGMTLAQLGADVIRFDPIGGGIDYKRWPATKATTENGSHSLYWHSLNKGKRSIAVDFKKPEGQELLTQLITAPGENAGLFVTNFPARGWLADENWRTQRKELIYLNLVGDRNGGSALDYTVNSKVGLPYLSSGEDCVPVNNPFPAWDVIAGQHIALGLLAAERHRRLTGAGQFIKLALTDVALATMGHLGYIAEADINGEPRQPVGNHIFGTFGHDFVCKGGRRVMVVGVSPNQWRAIVAITRMELAVAELAQSLRLNFNVEGDRYQAREQLKKLFDPWFRERPFAKVEAALNDANVCWGPYQSIQEMVDSDIDCSEDNPLFNKVEQPRIGTYLMPSNPLIFGAIDRETVKPAPQLGQHTDEILADTLKLSSAEIGRLHDQKIVAGLPRS